MNLSACSQLAYLKTIYTLAYICENYNIYCDDSCITDGTYNCYCYCDSEKIYCYGRYYYFSKFFSVLLIGLLFACFCYFLMMCLYTSIKNNNKNILPAYNDIQIIKN
jgi:hypothetical protein